jgi:hypothetical protein
MHFVCSAYSAHIAVIPVRPYFKTLMNDDIVHQKITQPVNRNTYAHIKSEVVIHDTGDVAVSAGYSKDEEEGIVLFKKTGFNLMVIFVQVPQKTVHHKLMGKPCHEFHEEESGYDDDNID